MRFRIESLELEIVRKQSIIDSIEHILAQEKIIVPDFELHSKQGKIYEYMKEKLRSPEAMFALASHETGGFTSNLARNHNNLFGLIKVASAPKPVYSSGDGHYKSSWEDWRDCVDYMALWQDKMEKRGLDLSSNEATINSLRKVNYATDPYHGRKVMHSYRNLFEERSKEDLITALICAL